MQEVLVATKTVVREVTKMVGSDPVTYTYEVQDGEVRTTRPAGAYATAAEMIQYYLSGEMPAQFEAIEDARLRQCVIDCLTEVRMVTQAGAQRAIAIPRIGRGKVHLTRSDLQFQKIYDRCAKMKAAHETDGMDTCWQVGERRGFVIAMMDDDIDLSTGSDERYRVRYDLLSSPGTVTDWKNPGIVVPAYRQETPWPAGAVETI